MVAGSTDEPNETVALIEDTDEDEINMAEEEKVVEVAIDSGCFAHCVEPDDIPSSVEIVRPPPGSKDFVGAGGHTIKRHGKATVIMEPMDEGGGEMVGNVMQVANVTRPLHSVGQVADTDKDILFTKGECVVVPGGSLAKHVKGLRIFARYKRNRGLYTARMRIRNPKAMPSRGFGRQGAAQ